MSRPKLLDLYCCQGGASVGYHRCGFDVTGVDIDPQPRYPFKFHQADALEFFANHANEYQAWHASPPCQAHTNAWKLQKNFHRDFIPDVRRMFTETNRYRVRSGVPAVPWVIENVPGAPLLNPVELCGPMFGLRTYRHRLFESNLNLTVPEHPQHATATTKMGRVPRDGEFMHVVGNFSGVDKAREVMGMPWANRDGLREAIPPAYTSFIGEQLISWLRDDERHCADSLHERTPGTSSSLGHRTGSLRSTDAPLGSESFESSRRSVSAASAGSSLRSDRGQDDPA